MHVRIADAPARSMVHGEPVWFCSDRCKERFAADPTRFGVGVGHSGGGADDRKPA
jgi:YHS domain-containing protein